MRKSSPEIQVASKHASLRVLVLRENWLGCTGLSAFNAFLRAGCWTDSISEVDYVPLLWRGTSMKVAARLLRSLAVREFNRALLAQSRTLQPHLFFCVKGPWVTAETLRAMIDIGITCYCYYPDLSFTAYGKYLPHALKEYDWVFITKSFGVKDLREKLGITSASYLPHAYDPDVHHPRVVTREALQAYGSDISFIGGWSPKKERILEELITKRPQLDLRIWGDRWQNLRAESPLRPYTQFQAIMGHGYATAISCSTINLGLLQDYVPGASQGDRITSRTFHIPACGGLMLHERTPDLLEIFTEDKDCVCFETVDELVQKVDELLADEAKRQLVATNGYVLVTAAHSWDHRVKHVLEHYSAHALVTH